MLTRLPLAVAAFALLAAPAWADCATMGGGYFISDSVQIKGTHYDDAGNATKLKCDTKVGDSIIFTIGAYPPRTTSSFSPPTRPAPRLRG